MTSTTGAMDDTECMLYCYKGVACDSRINKTYATTPTWLNYLSIKSVKIDAQDRPAGIEPSEQETRTSSQQPTRGLWVGMYTEAAVSAVDDIPDVRGGPRSGGLTKATASATVHFDPDRAFRVIVLENAKTCKFYVLVNPAQGLCSAKQVNGEYVLFFEQYRADHLTTKDIRQSVWNQKIVLAAKHATTFTVTKETDIDPARYMSKTLDFANQMQFMVSSFKQTGDPAYFVKCKEYIHKRQQYIRDQPQLGNTMINKLLSSEFGIPFSADDAEACLSQINAAWSDFAPRWMTSTTIVATRIAIEAGSVVVPTKLHRAFFVIFLRTAFTSGLLDEPHDRARLGVCAETALHVIVSATKGMTDASQPTSTVTHSDSMLKDMKLLYQSLKSSVDVLGPSIGRVFPVEDIAQLHEAFRNSPDVEAYTALVDASSRLALERFVLTQWPIVDRMGEMIAEHEGRASDQ